VEHFFSEGDNLHRKSALLSLCFRSTFSERKASMAWYLNKYKCEDCGVIWEDQWSCGCDDECPGCGDDLSPFNVDMSAYVEKTEDGTFAVYYSPPDAGHDPSYTFFAEVIMENVALALAEIAKDIAFPK
jgi:hypothetical protein